MSDAALKRYDALAALATASIPKSQRHAWWSALSAAEELAAAEAEALPDREAEERLHSILLRALRLDPGGEPRQPITHEATPSEHIAADLFMQSLAFDDPREAAAFMRRALRSADLPPRLASRLRELATLSGGDVATQTRGSVAADEGKMK